MASATIGVMTTHQSGSCHCGKVGFELELDSTRPGLRCNCSYCRKVRSWAVFASAAQFRLTRGLEHLSVYAFGQCRERHHFCAACGVRVYGQGGSAEAPQYTVSLACLDTLSDTQLAELPVRHIDGAHERWDTAPDEVRHL